MILDPERHWLYVRSMGKALRVTAIFPSDDTANQYLASHRDQGCIAVFGSYVLIANLYDPGIRLPKDSHDHQARKYFLPKQVYSYLIQVV